MKKRVLSLLLACFMVVSTFIISKPLVHVHAVEDETVYTENENQWTLPTDWSTGKVEKYMESIKEHRAELSLTNKPFFRDTLL